MKTAIGIVVFLVLSNLAVALRYGSRMYPHTTVLGVDVSSLTYQAAQTKVRQNNPLPNSLKLTYQDKKAQVKSAELGLYVDVAKLPEAAKQGRHWPPLIRLLTKHVLAAPVRIDQPTYNAAISELSDTFHQNPVPGHIMWQNNQFRSVQATPGFQLNSSQFKTALLQGITQGDAITVPVTPIPPSSKMADPAKALQAVKGQLDTSITLQFGAKTDKAKPQDIASWYIQSGNDFVLSEETVRTYVARTGSSLGVAPQNIDQATLNTVDALKHSRTATVKLFARVVTYHYCVTLRGVDAGNLSELEKRLNATYTDARGWSLDGQVIFKAVSSGCDYTVWLAAGNQMPSFGAICDATWSCTINNNVIINYDRWQNATTTWNAAHAGSIDEYRAMAINHETGHQLGFQHSACTNPGNPAPVMEQQSIDLQGCTFNAWPIAAEQNTLRSKLGL